MAYALRATNSATACGRCSRSRANSPSSTRSAGRDASRAASGFCPIASTPPSRDRSHPVADDLHHDRDRLAAIARFSEETGGLGLFIRSLVGLDRTAAVEAFGDYLDGTRFTVDQVRFVNLIVDELTANGIMEPARLFESPYIDHAPTGPDYFFPDADVDVIVEILRDVRRHALPTEVA